VQARELQKQLEWDLVTGKGESDADQITRERVRIHFLSAMFVSLITRSISLCVFFLFFPFLCCQSTQWGAHKNIGLFSLPATAASSPPPGPDPYLLALALPSSSSSSSSSSSMSAGGTSTYVCRDPDHAHSGIIVPSSSSSASSASSSSASASSTSSPAYAGEADDEVLCVLLDAQMQLAEQMAANNQRRAALRSRMSGTGWGQR
jgi:hypothetical protein